MPDHAATIGLEVPPGQLYPVSDLPTRPWMPRKDGKPISMAAVWRFVLQGGKHGRMKSLKIGGTRCTCDEWAMEYFNRRTNPDAASRIPNTRTPARRRCEHERADARLAAAGI